MTGQDDTLGVRLRRARRRKELSQQQVADALGVTRQTVNRWERDIEAQDGITYARQRQLADLYGVSLGDLLPECSEDDDDEPRRRAA